MSSFLSSLTPLSLHPFPLLHTPTRDLPLPPSSSTYSPRLFIGRTRTATLTLLMAEALSLSPLVRTQTVVACKGRTGIGAGQCYDRPNLIMNWSVTSINCNAFLDLS